MKKALLVVSFGVNNLEARRKTIDVCENEISQSFQDFDFFKAYTSNRIIEKIKAKENLDIDNPERALEKIYQGGYDEVIIQPLHIICGGEFNKLKLQVDLYQDKFKKIKLGRPLLTDIEDYLNIADMMKKYIPTLNDGEAIVFMGHGSSNEAQIAYPTLEYVLRDNGINAFVGTIKGYPGINPVIRRLEENKIKKVILKPFLLVAGHHVTKDMIGDKEDSWKNSLERLGYEVEISLESLGENPCIRKQFIKHAHHCLV